MVARPLLGVLGGSFNPPHVGHLVLASVACGQLGLAHVLFVPAAVPPHKVVAEDTPAALRVALTEAAVAGDTRFAVSRVELDEHLRYSRDVLAALRKKEPDADIVFLMGSDSLLQFHTWFDPAGVLELASLAVAPRPGDDPQAVASAAARWKEHVTMLDVPPLDVSSTDVRRRVRQGSPIRYLVPAAVEDLIVREGLYRS